MPLPPKVPDEPLFTQSGAEPMKVPSVHGEAKWPPAVRTLVLHCYLPCERTPMWFRKARTSDGDESKLCMPCDVSGREWAYEIPSEPHGSPLLPSVTYV